MINFPWWIARPLEMFMATPNWVFYPVLEIIVLLLIWWAVS